MRWGPRLTSCDELRGGMDASQYKNVLVLLFIKYVSDKYFGVPYAPITIPKGASFNDVVALKGKPDIGDQINKKIIAPLANANKLSDMPDFNEVSKLGSGKEMVERLTNLIAIFENKALDFSKNRAEGDDILGDAYEYLMRISLRRAARARGSSTRLLRSAESLRRFRGYMMRLPRVPLLSTIPLAGLAHCCLRWAMRLSPKLPSTGRRRTPLPAVLLA
jgi:hypothetical protein